MTEPRRIAVILESRATYGYSRNVMRVMRDFPELELVTLVTGMHLMPELGNSVDVIRADGYPVSMAVPFNPGDEGRAAWPRAMGRAIEGYADALDELAPDIVLLSGDRAESLAVCVTAAYMGLPIAHIQAGDKSGHIDDAARHAIGKLVHIHFASCEDSANRLLRMGEEKFRVFNVGAPQLDDIAGRDFHAGRIAVDDRIHDLSRPYLVLLQHPIMAERDDVKEQMRSSLEACLETGMPVFWIYPNSDSGYGRILELVEEHRGGERLTLLANLERDDFLTLLANAAALVGNSSSGILEAPSLHIPVVNIGNRQRGRPQASNIVDCGYGKDEIAAAIDRALNDPGFRAACSRAVNPYGDGRSGARICETLRDISLDRRLLDKQCTY